MHQLTILMLSATLAITASTPGAPGVEWSADWVRIIRQKIEALWDRPNKFTRGLYNINSGHSGFNKFVFDPELKTVTPPYDRCVSKEKCNHMFRDMDTRLEFSPELALRLAFHDCIPYITDEGEIEGGCDGCLNMEQGLKGNMGLQYTVATLEKLFLEPDYPSHKRVPKLPESPRDLGISRADLWAFAGLVALDRFQTETKSTCSGQVGTGGATCRWWERPDYDNTQCFQEFPKTDAVSMFKTGRIDCETSSSATEWQQYLASRQEHQPEDNGNGAMTVSYYDRAFGLTGKEGLVLMGVHAVGRLNVQFSGNAYSWVRGAKLFNNKYYKLLAGEPDRVFDSCTGTLDDKPAPGSFNPIANIHFDTWKEEEVWGSKEKVGHIRWDMSFSRGPDCGPEDSFGRQQDDDDYWGRRDLWDTCCSDNLACSQNMTCHDLCTFHNGNKNRFIGADAGYMLKWEIEDGLPRGCSVFKNKKGEYMTNEEFRSAGQLRKNGQELGCPRQDLDDGEGRALADTVEHFAHNLQDWIDSFVVTFTKMQANGYSEGQLRTQNLDVKFFTQYD